MSTASGVTFSEEERECLRLLFSNSKAKLCAIMDETNYAVRTSITTKLNQILHEVCTDTIKKRERPHTLKERAQAFLEIEGKLEVLFEFQSTNLINRVLQEAEPEVAKITANPVLEMKYFIDKLFVVIGGIKVSEDQHKYFQFLLKESKTNLIASVTKAQRFYRNYIIKKLKETVLAVCADIIGAEPLYSMEENVIACLGEDGTQFASVMVDMQVKGLVNALLLEADPRVTQITTNPMLELQKFIDQTFAVLETFAEPPTLICAIS